MSVSSKDNGGFWGLFRKKSQEPQNKVEQKPPTMQKAQPSVDEAKKTTKSKRSKKTNKKELVAVITAALCAAMDVPPDGLRIRSIKKLSTNEWNRRSL